MSKMSAADKCGFETFPVAEAVRGSARTSGHVVARRGQLRVVVDRALRGERGNRFYHDTFRAYERTLDGSRVAHEFVIPDGFRGNLPRVLAWLSKTAFQRAAHARMKGS